MYFEFLGTLLWVYVNIPKACFPYALIPTRPVIILNVNFPNELLESFFFFYNLNSPFQRVYPGLCTPIGFGIVVLGIKTWRVCCIWEINILEIDVVP